MKIIELIQGSEKWLDYRKNKIGASDAPIITGDSPWCTPVKLWERKLGFSIDPPISNAMRRGINFEPIARQTFQNMTNRLYPPIVVQHDVYHWMIASLDGFNEYGHPDNIKTILEIKIPGQSDHQQALAGEIPKKYYPQLQHQLAVTGCDLLYYFSFDGSNGVTIEVPRNEEYIADLIEKEKIFYKLLVTHTPPDPSDKDYICRDDDDWHQDCIKWKQAKNNLEMAEEIEKRCREKLIANSSGQNTRGCGITVAKGYRRGVVDYSLIEALNGIDLDKFRKQGSEFWRIRKE